MEIQGNLGGLLSDERSKNGFLFLASRRFFSMVRSLHLSIFEVGGFSRVDLNVSISPSIWLFMHVLELWGVSWRVCML